MSSQTSETCIACGVLSLPLDEDNTLRSSLGWRLHLERRADGTTSASWYCPSCWQKRKEASRPGEH